MLGVPAKVTSSLPDRKSCVVSTWTIAPVSASVRRMSVSVKVTGVKSSPSREIDALPVSVVVKSAPVQPERSRFTVAPFSSPTVKFAGAGSGIATGSPPPSWIVRAAPSMESARSPTSVSPAPTSATPAPMAPTVPSWRTTISS